MGINHILAPNWKPSLYQTGCVSETQMPPMAKVKKTNIVLPVERSCYTEAHVQKKFGTNRKILSQGIIMWNMKTLALTVHKLLARIKFVTEWMNDRQNINNINPNLPSLTHKINITMGKNMPWEGLFVIHVYYQ